MKRMTFALVWTLAVFSGLAVAAPPVGGGKTAASPLTVVDATGKSVGLLGHSYSMNAPLAYTTLNGKPTAIALEQSSVNGNLLVIRADQFALLFTTANCTGTPYLYAVNAAGVGPTAAYTINGLKYLYTATTSAVSTITWLSSFNYGQCQTAGAALEAVVSPAGAPVNAATLFTEPFSVQ